MATTARKPEQGAGIGRWIETARWNLQRSTIITRREVVDMLRDWRILSPIILLTLIFPSIANWGAGRMTAFVSDFGADLIGERLVPFLLMIVGFFPISFSLIIALETFVGEKERRSLEPLLSSPLTNVQLYIGKMLASTIPPLIGSLLGITVYLVGVYFNIDYRPPFILLIQILLLTIVQAFVMVAGAVVVSSQTTSVRASNLLASFIIIPMAFLIQAEALIMFWARYDVLWIVLLGLAVLTVVLIRMGIRSFNRQELIGSEIDELNLIKNAKEWWRLTWKKQEGRPRSAWEWYRDEVLLVIWQLRYAALIIAVAFVVAAVIGRQYAMAYRIPPELFDLEQWTERFSAVLVETGLSGVRGVLFVVMQNARALLLATVIAVFSFGIAMILVLMIPIVLISFLVVQLIHLGIAPSVALAAVAPHGAFEIPAAIIAGAAAVKLGASVLAPPEGKTLGQGWLIALADLTRLWVALVIPLLILAGIAEVYISPLLVSTIGG